MAFYTMVRRSRKDSEKTRAAIVAAARKRFEANGFSDTTIADICADTEVTKGALFHHFPSKEALFKEIWLDMEIEMDRAAAAEAIRVGQTSADPLAGFLAGCRVFLEYVSRPEFQQVVNIDGPVVLGVSEWSERDAGMGLRNIGGGLRELARQGYIADENRNALTVLLYGALTGAGLALARGESRATSEELFQAFEAMLRNAL